MRTFFMEIYAGNKLALYLLEAYIPTRGSGLMKAYTEYEIIVRPTDGMQLSVGSIRWDEFKASGILPALPSCFGETVEEVRVHLEQEAKDFYGDDVFVEIIQSCSVES